MPSGHDTEDQDFSLQRVVSDPKADAMGYLLYALVFAALPVIVIWYFEMKLIFDVNDPEFNPVLVLFAAVALLVGWYLVKSAQCLLRHRRFGASVAEIPVDGLTPGALFSGRIVMTRKVPATGDFKIKLRYIEIFHHRDDSKVTTNEHWSNIISVPPSRVESARGLPFSFMVPATEHLARRVEMGATVKVSALISYGLPGFQKKVIAHNRQADASRWELSVTAPCDGLDYAETFIIPQSLYHQDLDDE